MCHCQMGRQDNDPTVVNSSIALLQERFRQLEKVKERREGKELLKLLSSSETQRGTSSLHNPTSQNSPQPRLMVPHRPSVHDSLSLGLNLNTKQGDHNNTMKSAPSSSSSSSSSLWPQGASSSSSSRNFDSSDVDTSLHL